MELEEGKICFIFQNIFFSYKGISSHQFFRDDSVSIFEIDCSFERLNKIKLYEKNIQITQEVLQYIENIFNETKIDIYGGKYNIDYYKLFLLESFYVCLKFIEHYDNKYEIKNFGIEHNDFNTDYPIVRGCYIEFYIDYPYSNDSISFHTYFERNFERFKGLQILSKDHSKKQKII